jgi:hypothetical protein
MKPEQIQKQLMEAMQRMADRLVQSGFARSHARFDTKNIGQIDWTADGIILQGHLKKVFEVPKVKPQDIPGVDIVALVHLLLLTKPMG